MEVNKKVEAMAVTTIKKFEVLELSFGSNPKEAKTGLVIIPPPIPKEDETIPAIIAINIT